MEAVLTYGGGIAFEATTESGHTVVIDGSASAGGQNLGARPMELVLLALGSCSGIDVALMIQKMRVELTEFSIRLDGQRRDEEPKVYKQITIEYRFGSPDLTAAQATRAVQLSIEKYCSVAEMLRATVALQVRVLLNEETVAEF